MGSTCSSNGIAVKAHTSVSLDSKLQSHKLNKHVASDDLTLLDLDGKMKEKVDKVFTMGENVVGKGHLTDEATVLEDNNSDQNDDGFLEKVAEINRPSTSMEDDNITNVDLYVEKGGTNNSPVMTPLERKAISDEVLMNAKHTKIESSGPAKELERHRSLSQWNDGSDPKQVPLNNSPLNHMANVSKGNSSEIKKQITLHHSPKQKQSSMTTSVQGNKSPINRIESVTKVSKSEQISIVPTPVHPPAESLTPIVQLEQESVNTRENKVNEEQKTFFEVEKLDVAKFLIDTISESSKSGSDFSGTNEIGIQLPPKISEYKSDLSRKSTRELVRDWLKKIPDNPDDIHNEEIIFTKSPANCPGK